MLGKENANPVQRSPLPRGQGLDRNTVNIVHGFGPASAMLADLREVGVVLSAQGALLAYDAPEGVLTPVLLNQMRTRRNDLLAALRAEQLTKSASSTSDAERQVDHDGDHFGDRFARRRPRLRRSAFTCDWCGGIDLVGESDGLRCKRCKRLAWFATSEGGLQRHDYAEPELEYRPWGENACCLKCGDMCDSLGMDDVWRCSRCDPEVASRRRRTARLLNTARRIQRRDARARAKLTGDRMTSFSRGHQNAMRIED